MYIYVYMYKYMYIYVLYIYIISQMFIIRAGVEIRNSKLANMRDTNTKYRWWSK